ncbi:MAG: hypothetical protein E7436_05730 [Ruminococcaceae bacterium]|nr:hypothetical protein [Oscillospiraceae bacterium]
MKKMLKILSLCLAVALMLTMFGCQPVAQQQPTNGNDPGATGEKEINEVTGLKDKPVILFMGDSITDGGRTNYKDKTFLGANHPKIVAQKLRQQFKNEEFIFYSTGVSGDTVLDQYFRLQEDCFDLKPDYIIMLLGINDCWSGYKGKEAFTKSYRFLLDAMTANTDAQIILIQPYLLPADDAMQANCVIPSVNNYKTYADEIADVVCTMAAEYKLDIIYLGEILEQQHEKGTAYIELASDAIHPTALAATILADQILMKLGVKGYTPAFADYDTSEIAAKYNN